MAYRLAELAEYLSGVGMPSAVDGNPDLEVDSVATLDEARSNEISFLANPKYEAALQTTSAGAVIVSRDQKTPEGLSVLRSPNPYAAVSAVMVHIHGYRKHPQVGISERAEIHETAVLGENANIHHGVTIAADVTVGKNAVMYPGTYVGAGSQLGDDCVLYPNVVIYDGCVLGDRVTIHAGSVIGEDGLGYAPVGDKWHKIPQVGIVKIGDDVEIGAGCAIDRATLGSTVIEAGTKFSNLIAIGHGSKIGENCMFVAQVGVAGSVNVGKHVTIAGKVGVAGHLSIGDNAEIGGMSGVMRDVPADTRVAGIPSLPIKDAMRTYSMMERLPQLNKQIKQLEARVEELQKALEKKPDSP